jgi:hypothetical protein
MSRVDAIIVTQGLSGVKSPVAATFRLRASPAIPEKFKLFAPGATLGESWTVAGVDFRQETGLLAVYMAPDAPDSRVTMATLFLVADGYERQQIRLDPSVPHVTDIFLVPQADVKIERVTKLNSNDDDSFALDIIISNVGPVDRYVNRISLVNLGILILSVIQIPLLLSRTH